MSTTIGPGRWVQIHYELRDGRGNLLESTYDEEPVGFVYGYGKLVPGLEEALEGFSKGELVDVTLQPEDAYGTRDEENVFEVERDEFPEDAELEPGNEFMVEGDDNTMMNLRIVEVHDDYVVVDSNHPLAGETLNFAVKVLDVRDATEDESLAARVEASDLRPPEGDPS